jgi:hypothetical protein
MFDVSFEGIGNTGTITFLSASGVAVANENQVGKLSAGQTIDVCDAEDAFYGVIGKVDEAAGILGLERHGMKEVSYTGTITPGYKELVADGLGGVKAPTVAGTGRMFHIVEVNSTDNLLFLDLG